MLSRVLFGDRLDFKSVGEYTQFFVNGCFICDLISTGNIERDIGLLMLRGYNE